MIIQIDRRHPKLTSRYGKDCTHFKQPPTDIDFKSKCDACRRLCIEEYRICRPAPKKPKAKVVDIGLKIKRRKKKPKPKQEKPQSYETCKGLLEENCEKCPKFPPCIFKIKEDGKQPIKWHSEMPHFISDKYMRQCTHAEWKVFSCLNRHANFDENSNNFGRCWLNYKTISEETGVYNLYIGACCKRLEDLSLIVNTQQKRNVGGRYVIVNHFTVTWFKRIKELRKKCAPAK